MRFTAFYCGLGTVTLLILAGAGGGGMFAQGYKPTLAADHPAIAYPQSPAHNVIEKLIAQLERGGAPLESRGGTFGYLPSLLDRLGLNADSQLLVFSKTSFQAPQIGPDNPRAIYFNDQVAVAYVPGSASLELMAVDPVQGPMFYVMSPGTSARPRLARGGVCLQCHQGPQTAGVPGPYVGSVIPGPSGAPLRDVSAVITDHRSPFIERWGGWYVTARRGDNYARANALALNPAQPASLVRESPRNLVTLVGRFSLANYLAPTSDIVALMTFEHQTQMTNLITRVGWQARMSRQAGGRDEAIARALDADIAALSDYMLFGGEAPLESPVEGVSSFTRSFAQRGPRDSRGRSLRDFDLQTRLFRYPVSYMIYSEAFDGLPADVRSRIYRRLHEALTSTAQAGGHVSARAARATLEILSETKPEMRP